MLSALHWSSIPSKTYEKAKTAFPDGMIAYIVPKSFLLGLRKRTGLFETEPVKPGHSFSTKLVAVMTASIEETLHSMQQPLLVFG